MNILHIWDQAGVACVLAKYQRKAGHNAKVIKTEADDPFGFLKFYGEEYVNSMTSNSHVFTEFDIFHLHSYRYLAKPLKQKYPKSKIILEYHGTDARCHTLLERADDEQYCDLILYSTPDLIEWVPNGIYLPLPIDTEHFKETCHIEGSLFMKSDHYRIPALIPFPFKVEKPVPYKDVPKVFELYDTYIDIQDNKGNVNPIEAHSKTALEALATGMKVYTYDRRMIKGLPLHHRPENVIKRLDYLYNLA